MPKIRLLLVDDHPFIREGIRSWLLRREPFEVVGEAANGQEALERAKKLRPDVVSMDINMPVMNGLEATRRLRQLLPQVKVLMLSFHEARDVLAQVLKAGARGYVSKSAPLPELGRALRAVHEGKTFFSAGSRAIGPWLSADSRLSRREGELTGREREVLAFLANGMSNAQVASALGLSVRTVEKHRERIMQKLKLHKIAELTRYAVAHRLIELAGASR